MNKRIAALWKFLTYDIWRITEDEVTRTTFSVYNIIKTIYLCINRFTKDRIVKQSLGADLQYAACHRAYSCHFVCHSPRFRIR